MAQSREPRQKAQLIDEENREMTLKKTLLVIATAASLSGLGIACGGSSEPAPEPGPPPAAEPTAGGETTPPAEATPAAEAPAEGAAAPAEAPAEGM